MPVVKSSRLLLLIVATLVGSAGSAVAHETTPPEIVTETRVGDDGKDVLYMFIDGVKVHETDPAKQPPPPVVAPGESAGDPPSDAIVLFDGTAESLGANWGDDRGGATKWRLVDGAVESVAKAGYLQSKREFGSCQLHLEWASPSEVKGDGQGRGNSGVFLQGRYEVQILDNFKNATYPDGQAGALYGRAKPLVNACRPPGEWQSYDIIFKRPLFGADGEVVRPAIFTVLHNGVLIHHHVELSGGTGWAGPHAVTPYEPHGDRGPILLQDHGNPVRFRNIWIRELGD